MSDNVPDPKLVAEARQRLRETNPDVATALDAIDLSIAGVRAELAETRELLRPPPAMAMRKPKPERKPEAEPQPDAVPDHEG